MAAQRSIIGVSIAGSLLLHAAVIGWAWLGAPGSGFSVSFPFLSSRPVVAKAERPEEPPPRMLGEADGIGTALNSVEGLVPQQAKEGDQEQAALTRTEVELQPTGLTLKENRPDFQTLAAPLQQPEEGAISSSLSLSQAIGQGAPSSRIPNRTLTPASPSPTDRPVESDNPTRQPETTSKQAESHQQATTSDRDSDAFSTSSGVDVTAGKVVARQGRAFKFTRPPNFHLATRADMTELGKSIIVIVFEIRLNEFGQVESVITTRSSGRASYDRAFELALAASTFEPRKDASGKPIPDQFPFAITIR